MINYIKKGLNFAMITKKSSNDEVIHHLKQMELMLLTDEEERGLNKILEIENLIKAPDVAYWMEEGLASELWNNETKTLVDDVKKKILKDHIIKEHISQCKGFIAYHILLSKSQDATVEIVYQNGEWLFSVVNSRGEGVSWVNQRFNSYFFNTSYERKFIEIVKENHVIKIDKQWLFKREDWFYSSDLFVNLKELLKQTSFQEISKSQDKPIFEDDLPPLPEDVVESGLSLNVQENIVVSSNVKIAEAMLVQMKEKNDVSDTSPISFIDEDLPPIPDEDYGLFGAVKSEPVVLPSTIAEKVIDGVPNEVEFTFGDDDIPEFEGGFSESTGGYSSVVENQVSNSLPIVTPVVSPSAVSQTEKAPGRFDNKVKFGKRASASSTGAMVPGPAPAPAKSGKSTGGFAPLVGGKILSEEDDCPFGDVPRDD